MTFRLGQEILDDIKSITHIRRKNQNNEIPLHSHENEYNKRK